MTRSRWVPEAMVVPCDYSTSSHKRYNDILNDENDLEHNTFPHGMDHPAKVSLMMIQIGYVGMCCIDTVQD